MRKIYSGCVEDRNDPLKLGRCRVRIVDIHTDDKGKLPTASLPWASPILPITSASVSGIGAAPVGPVPGSWVAISFLDDDMQQPMMIGTVPGLPQSEAAKKVTENSDAVIINGKLIGPNGDMFTDLNGAVSTLEQALNSIQSLESEVIGAVDNAVDSVTGVIYNAVGAVTGVIDDTIGAAVGAVDNAIDAATGAITGVIDNAVGAATGMVSSALESSIDVVSETLEDIVGTSFSGVASQASGIASGVSGAIGQVSSLISSFTAIPNDLIRSIAGTLPTDKVPVNQIPFITGDALSKLDPSKQLAMLEDRAKNAMKGFTDPFGKYPLKTTVDSQDTNRLARGESKGTIHDFIKKARTLGIPAPNGESSWEQPQLEFGGQYPYCSVAETESGHVSYQDNTPGKEATCDYHRSGSFNHTAANGQKVTKIVGKSYTIVDDDGNVSIQGNCKVSVGGKVSIFVQGDANIQVVGNTVAKLNKNAHIEVGLDANIHVLGNTVANLDQNADITVGQNANVHVCGETVIRSDKNVNWTVGGHMTVDVTGILTVRAAALRTFIRGNTTTEIDGDIHTRGRGSMDVELTGPIDVKTDNHMSAQAKGNFDIKSDDTLSSQAGNIAVSSNGAMTTDVGGAMTTDVSGNISTNASGPINMKGSFFNIQ